MKGRASLPVDPKKLKIWVNSNLMDIKTDQTHNLGFHPGWGPQGEAGSQWKGPGMRSQRRSLNKRGKLPPRSVASSPREGVVPSAQHQKSPELGAVPRLGPQFREKRRSWRGTSRCCWQGWGLGATRRVGWDPPASAAACRAEAQAMEPTLSR